MAFAGDSEGALATGRATGTAAKSAVYSAQWKVGPMSETSIGNSGRKTYYVAHLGRTANETGFQDFDRYWQFEHSCV
jgi:hypothetical protein